MFSSTLKLTGVTNWLTSNNSDVQFVFKHWYPCVLFQAPVTVSA